MLEKYLILLGYEIKILNHEQKVIIYKQDIKYKEYDLDPNLPLEIKLEGEPKIIIYASDFTFTNFNVIMHTKTGLEFTFTSGKDKMEFTLSSYNEGFKYGLDLSSKKIVWQKYLSSNNYLQCLKYAEDEETLFQITETINTNINFLKKSCLIEQDKEHNDYYFLKTSVNDEEEIIALLPYKSSKNIARHLMASKSIKDLIDGIIDKLNGVVPGITSYIFNQSRLAYILITEMHNAPQINPIFNEIIARSHIDSIDVTILHV